MGAEMARLTARRSDFRRGGRDWFASLFRCYRFMKAAMAAGAGAVEARWRWRDCVFRRVCSRLHGDASWRLYMCSVEGVLRAGSWCCSDGERCRFTALGAAAVKMETTRWCAELRDLWWRE